MRAQSAFRDVDDPYANVYSAEDLHYLRSILAEALADLRNNGAAPEDETELKSRMAIAIFRCAETGERDRATLGREARRAARPS